ncbi:MAG: hypothetical protein QM696_08780 [Steroidobacteraceae bacterium]
MNSHPDLGELRRQWHSQRAEPLDVGSLHNRVQTESRAQSRALLIAALVTATVLGVVFARALLARTPGAWFGALWTLLFMAVMWPVSLWLARGTRRPRDESTLAHIEVSIRRSRAALITAPVGIVLYLIGLASTLLMRRHLFGGAWSELLSSTPMIITGWIGVPLYAGSLLWYARGQRQRLKVLEALRRQLGEG